MRITCQVADVDQADARQRLKVLNSLRTFLQSKNRPEAVINSLTMLNKPKTDQEKYVARLTMRGMAIQEEFEDISDGDIDFDDAQSCFTQIDK